MPNKQYVAGRLFEQNVARWLAEHGLAVVRAAGSKGAGKMDLVAFAADGRILIIQCKATGAITPGEWNRLMEISRWHRNVEDGWSVGGCEAGVVPLVAMRGPRAMNGQGWAPRFLRLADVKVPRSRAWPWKVYDAVHGRDVDLDDTPKSGRASHS